MRADLIRGHLDLLLLAVVVEQPAHGYTIIETLRGRSRGDFNLPEGTVYPALHRLEAAGLLTGVESLVDGRRRRTYSVTHAGRGALVERRAEWRRFAGSVEATIGGTA